MEQATFYKEISATKVHASPRSIRDFELEQTANKRRGAKHPGTSGD
jgi:hypothetical protein